MHFLRKDRMLFLLCLVLALFIFAFGLFGCGPGTSAPDVEEPPLDENGEDDLMSAEPIVLGVPGSLEYTTPDSALKAVKLAVEEVNNAGGVKVGDVYRPMKVVAIDTRDLEPGIPLHDALAAVEKLLFEEKPHALLVGPTRSEVMLAAMDLVSEAKIPHLLTIPFTMEMQKRITEDYESYKYYFRVCPDVMYIGWLSAQSGLFVMDALGLDKVAYLVYQDTIALQGTAAGVKMLYEMQGVEVVGMDPYPVGASDFSATVSNAIRLGASIIHPTADAPEFGVLVRQALSMEFPGLIVGYVTPTGFEDGWEVYDGEIDGMVGPALQMGNIPVKAYPMSVAFYENYGKMWGEAARKQIDLHGPAPSYDAVFVLKDAIERAGTLDGDALVEALKETDYMGVVGRIRFDELHQAIYGVNFQEEAIGIVYQWQNGFRVPVFPPNIAEGELVMPEHMQ